MQARDETLIRLNEWVQQSELSGFSGAFVFGSLIVKDGQQFDGESSDIDLLYTFGEIGRSFDRFDMLSTVFPKAEALEILLLRALKRRVADKPIVSHSVLTPIEISTAIHKDGQEALLTIPRFLKLPADRINQPIIAVSVEPDRNFVDLNREPSDVFAFVQRIRNEYLSSAPNSLRRLESHPICDDPLPKAFMRKAATLAWFEGKVAIENREDLASGLDYLCSLISELDDHHPVLTPLKENISVRRGARGTPKPLEPDDLLLVAEILFDKALAVSKKSISQRLMAAAERTIGRNQIESDPKSS